MKLDPETLKAMESACITDSQLDEAIEFFHDLKDALDSLGPKWGLATGAALRKYRALRIVKDVRSW